MSDGANLKELAEKYVALRDKRAELKARYEERDAEFKSVMAQIEATLQEQFEELGINSVNVGGLTVYKSTTTSYSVSDWDSLVRYVKDRDAFDLLQKRVSSSVAKAYEEEAGEPPAGLSKTIINKINVRKK